MHPTAGMARALAAMTRHAAEYAEYFTGTRPARGSRFAFCGIRSRAPARVVSVRPHTCQRTRECARAHARAQPRSGVAGATHDGSAAPAYDGAGRPQQGQREGRAAGLDVGYLPALLDYTLRPAGPAAKAESGGHDAARARTILFGKVGIGSAARTARMAMYQFSNRIAICAAPPLSVPALR